MKGLSLRSNSLIYIAMETDTTADTTLPPAIIAGIAGGLAALVIVLLVSFCVILCEFALKCNDGQCVPTC